MSVLIQAPQLRVGDQEGADPWSRSQIMFVLMRSSRSSHILQAIQRLAQIARKFEVRFDHL